MTDSLKINLTLEMFRPDLRATKEVNQFDTESSNWTQEQSLTDKVHFEVRDLTIWVNLKRCVKVQPNIVLAFLD